ncbi:MAG TPA: S-layer homology domain-containing protein [Candidatus Scatomorpha gallistercoris]|nr:S-layer homology domain-containing protein [Candidatus Scatomorpha gallistercoris]
MKPNDPAPEAKISIEGGTYVGLLGLTQYEGIDEYENFKEASYTVSDGNFSSSLPKEYLAPTLTAELYSRSNPAAPYSYYPSVEDALEAAQPGDVVTDLSGVTTNTRHEVKFDNNGTVDTINVLDGATITLTAPARSGYTFGGWRYGNTVYKAGETVKVTSDMTFTAIWNAINIPDTYDIDLVVGEGGEAKTNFSNASAGTTITVTVTPDEGYKLDYITVDGERISGTSFKMPAHDVTVRVYFTDGTSALPFTDVSANQWFYDAVAYVYTNGMMEGDSATTFNPDGRMTRAMFWAVLGRIDGATITGANWVETARSWAMAEGVSDGTNPNDYVTREMMVTMLWRYAGEPASDESLSGYSDAANVSDWAAEAMSWALETGVIEGVTATTLQPQGTATRAQCATIFMRYDMI